MSIVIQGQSFECEAISRALTVPDCNVVRSNKLGTGNGEGKFYFGSKQEMNAFFGGVDKVRCFFLRSDLTTYMGAIQCEYQSPSQKYTDVDRFKELWSERNLLVSGQDDVIYFNVDLQHQIAGPRGYVNSDDDGYRLFRVLSLPLTSYITIMRLRNGAMGTVFYWKLFVDYTAISQRKSDPLVFTYGKAGEKRKAEEEAQQKKPSGRTGRDGQQEYRQRLLQDCPFCPITGITDDRLLIASHIKPFAVCSEHEQYDRNNGFILSPLYDRLFDQGFLSFSDERTMKVSMWLNNRTQSLCGIKEGQFVQHLPMTDERKSYLDYHRKYVFKG